MMIKKIILGVLCVILTCCLCLGCGNDKMTSNGTRVMKDSKGFEVKVPEHPQRILSKSGK